MTYDSRKTLRGQEFVEEIEIKLDACRFTQGNLWTDRYLSTLTTYTDAYTGAITVDSYTVGWAAYWSGVLNIYMLTDTGEIVEVSVSGDTAVSILARAQFGTTAASFDGDLKIIHQGEADNSCRGFPHNCSSPDSYDSNVKLNLIFSSGLNAGGVRRFAGLFHKKVKHDAGEVDVGESMGARSKINVVLQDQIHNDFQIVPYEEKRTLAGTLFGKALARHPYFVGREVLYREGYRDANTFDIPDFIERTFIIDSVNLTNGKFSINALDPLIATEDKKAKMPVVSPMTLSAAISGAPATFNYLNAPDFYTGPLASTAYLRIDSEVIIATVSGATEFTVVTRGYKSEIKNHEAGASIQDCIVFSGTHGIDAIEYALLNYTKINSAFIDDYSAVKALLPIFILSETIITKPMAVSLFINILIKIGNLIFYFDEISKKIVIDYIPELQAEAISINEAQHIERDSIKIDYNIKNQFTRFSQLWAPVDITKDTEENFAIRYLQANLNLESDGQLGEINEKKEFKNILLNSSAADSLLATAYVARVLDSTITPPKIATFSLDASSVGLTQNGNLKLGSIVNLSTLESQDKDGNAISEIYQVLKLSGNGYAGFDCKLRRYQSIEAGTIDFTIDTNKINYDLSTEFAPAAGTYTIYISPGVIIGSNNTSIPAFDTGTQAPGVSFILINKGSILGMGGDGGNARGGIVAGGNGFPGEDAGPAFNATVNVVINTAAGLIWAGGGGGVGQGSENGLVGTRYGGSGGQGFGTSNGGINTIYTDLSPDPPLYIADGSTAPNGSQASPGGGSSPGGAWGEDGNQIIPSVLPGKGGYSIVSNGNSVTFSAGDNSFNIKGLKI